jgi:tungstate transport system substrate-binding protein
MHIIKRLCHGLMVLTVIALLGVSAEAKEAFITLASTTSTQASGFFDYFLPLFKKKRGSTCVW